MTVYDPDGSALPSVSLDAAWGRLRSEVGVRALMVSAAGAIAAAGGCLTAASGWTPSAVAVDYARVSFREDGIAVVPVRGLLVPHECWLTQYYDASALETILQDVTQAMDDGQVRAVVLAINSGGGSLDGCGEVVQQLLAYRGRKPMRAHVSGDAGGTAYWLAAACDAITIEPTSTVGGLGVQLAYLDDQAWLEAHGLEEIVLTSAQTPEKNLLPNTPAGLQQWQQLVDDLAAVMLQSIAAARGLTPEALAEQGGDGRSFVGARAVALGLADEVGMLADVRRTLRPVKSGPGAGASAGLARLTATKTGGAAIAPTGAHVPTVAEQQAATTQRVLDTIRQFNPQALKSPTP